MSAPYDPHAAFLRFCEHAERLIIEHGALAPAFFITSDDDDVLVLESSGETSQRDRHAMAMYVRVLGVAQRARSICTVFECWMTEHAIDTPVASLPNPADNPARVEVVLTQCEYRRNDGGIGTLVSMRPIERDAAGAVTGLSADIAPTKPSGRMTGLLSPQIPSEADVARARKLIVSKPN
jgi:hypothetical protein